MTDQHALFQQLSETCLATQAQLDGLYRCQPVVAKQAEADLRTLVDFGLAACLDNDEQELRILIEAAACLLSRCSSLSKEQDAFQRVAA